MMGRFVIRDAVISINSVDLSDHVTSVTVDISKPGVDATVFGSPGSEMLHGVPSDTFTVNFHQDFAATEVDATLWPLFDNETEFPVTVRAFPADVSSTNPQYGGACKLFAYQPLQGSVGDISQTSIDFEVQGKITRLTSTT
jgi:hypothetical protein